jgi:hypothetical protein
MTLAWKQPESLRPSLQSGSYHSPQFIAGCATRGLNRDPLNHGHDIAGKIGGVRIARQISFCLRALKSQAHRLLSRVTAQN